MKKLIITSALLAFASAASFAQAVNSPNAVKPNQQQQRPQMNAEQMQQRQTQRAEQQTQFFKKQYGLNDEQTKGVQEANMNFMKNMDAKRAEGKQPTRDEMDKMMADRDAAFKKSMSSEQYAKYAATRANHGAAKQQNVQINAAPAQH